MVGNFFMHENGGPDDGEWLEGQADGFDLSRRSFLGMLGAGLLITVTGDVALGQRAARQQRGAQTIAARLHIDMDGRITVMTGKVEEGQGSRAQLTLAAAEELRVEAGRVHLVMADTDLVPDDGITAGSRTTPSTVPAVRRGAAAARELLTSLAAEQWQVEAGDLEVREGAITHPATRQTMSYADLAGSVDLKEAFQQAIPPDVEFTPVGRWEVLGKPYLRPNSRDLVTGDHRFPSDIVRPGMLHGKILRPPSYGATLETVDLSKAEAMENVVAVRDGEFVGCAAPTSFLAEQAVEAVAETASWKTIAHPSSKELFSHLKKTARSGGRRSGSRTRGDIESGLAQSGKVLEESYEVSYIQHVPMEPRAAVAEWKDGRLTVWAGVDWPQRAQRDLARVFDLSLETVRVIVPDMGGGFGGKHSAEAAEEAARLAKAAGRPVSVRWTRKEEFTWAYFRPAALIECKGGVGGDGSLAAWEFININAGSAAIDTPYEIPNTRILSMQADAPLSQGPYRCLAATANNFARESFMDELAAAAGADPLEFRLAHLENPRIRAVLEAAAERFDWSARRRKITPERSVGLACGTEKNSCVAACVEVGIDRGKGEIKALEVCEVFECGPIQNPANLVSQVQGCIVMGLGGALSEEIRFADGKILNPTFARYRVPRFTDVPKIDVHLINNTDIPSAGGGETPIIAVAPAIGNAVYLATGVRLRSLPMRGERLRPG